MALTGYSLPDTLTDDAGNTLKGVTVTVTGPGAYSGTATSDASTGILRLGPLPVGDYTITLGSRSILLPVVPSAADVQAAFDNAEDALATADAAAAGLAAKLDITTASGTYSVLGHSHSGAGLPSTIVNRTSAYTAAAGDFVLCDATAGGFTVTLPSAPATGSLVTVKKTDVSANVVTVDPPGAVTVDGDPNATIVAEGAGAVFSYDGTGWQIVAVTSAAGPQGETGPEGPEGPEGPQGDTGPAGTSGGGPSGFISTKYYTSDGMRSNGGGPNQSVMAAFPFAVGSSARSFDRIGLYVWVGAVGGTFRLGIYSDNAGKPDALLLDAGTVPATTGGEQVLTISQSLSGVVWLAAVPQGAAVTALTFVGGGASQPTSSRVGTTSITSNTGPSGYTRTGVSGALPSTWGSTYTDASPVPIVWLRAA